MMASYSTWREGRHDFAPSASLEYDISDNNRAITFDLGYGYSI